LPAKIVVVQSRFLVRVPSQLILLPLAFLPGTLLPVSAPAAAATTGQAPAPVLSPAQAQALIQRALATESLAAQDLSHVGHPMRYRLHKTSPRLTSTKEIVETKDGDVARLISINDQPLSQADEQKEQARLQELLDNPSLQQHRKQSEGSDTARAMKVLRVLPAAFLYQFAGTVSTPNGTVIKFTFKPNPQFDPPDAETGVLTAMAGEIWVDPVEERVVRLAGSLQQDKLVYWGLGELKNGGWIEIGQADVGGHQWRIVHLKLKMDIRELFKVKPSDSVQEYTEFVALPAAMSYKDAIQMLRSNSWPITPGTH
jgi:hypothetical protein